VNIYLLRHGKTLANENNFYCGQTDLPLTESGTAELVLLKNTGVYPLSPELLFTSGMRRAEQTLEVIYGDSPRRSVPLMAEYRFGEFEMKKHEELSVREDYCAWINDSGGMKKCPQGECRKQFEERVISGYSLVLETVLHNHAESALVCCHGGVIACVMNYLNPGVKNFYEWHPALGRGYGLIYVAGQFVQYKNL
jgi:alpha-ribazole phosphatase